MSYTLEQLNAAERFANQVEELEAACGLVREQLNSADINQAQSFNIARVPKQDEALPRSRIEVDKLDFIESRARALAALTDWYGEHDCSTKIVHRTPGALCVHTANPEALQAAIEQCNTIKIELQNTIRDLGPRNDRFELIHARHHMMILPQLTRRFTALLCPPDVRSVTFSWGFKTEIKKLTLDEACSVLERQKERKPVADHDGVPWDTRIDAEIARLQSLPAGTELRHRRPLNVRPLANIRFVLTEQQKEERHLKMINGERVNQPTIGREAHTPIVLINPRNAVKLGDLETYQAETRGNRKQRSGKITANDPLTQLAPIFAVVGGKK